MNDPTLPLPGLSPVGGKSVVAKFDGGLLSSNGGVLALREVEKRLRVADRIAACIEDPRAPDQITHTLADIIRFPLLMMALDLAPSDRELCSQPTISRLENLPDVRSLLRMGRAMVDLYCTSFGQVPKRIMLDIDDTFDAVHGGQQLRLFNAHYDRIRVPAHRRLRWRGAVRHRRAAARQAPEGHGNPRPPAPAAPGHPRQLAEHGDPAARRQPLLRPGGPRLVSRQRG